MGQGSGRRQSRKARHGEITRKSWSNRTKIWGAGTWGEVMQAMLPLSVVLNHHCFVWMPVGGVNYFGEQYGDLTILEKNSNTLSSCASMFLTTTSMLIVPKPIYLALKYASLNAYFQLSAKHHLHLLHWIYFKLNRSKNELVIFTNVPACLTVFYILINGTKICSFSQTKNLGDLNYFHLSAFYT